MSVLSKALSVALVVGFITGCSTTPEGYVSTETSEMSTGEEIAINQPESTEVLSVAEHGIGLAILEGYNGSNAEVSTFSLLPDGMTAYEVSQMESPPRLIIDVAGLEADETKTYYLDGSAHVESLRFGKFGEFGRLVFDLRPGVDISQLAPQVTSDGEELLVRLGEGASNADRIAYQEQLEAESLEASTETENANLDASDELEAVALRDPEVDEEAFQGSAVPLTADEIEELYAVNQSSLEDEDSEQAARARLSDDEPLAQDGHSSESHVERGVIASPSEELIDEKIEVLDSEYDVSDSLAEAVDVDTDELEEVQVVAASEVAEHTVSANLSNVAFIDSETGKSEIHLGLDQDVPFDLSRTTSTEYALTLPGVKASESTLAPVLAPIGKQGIRSARVVQRGENSIVRMFVSDGIGLFARKEGQNIVIEPQRQVARTPSRQGSPYATNADARAQMKEEQVQVSGGASDSIARVNPTGVASDDGKKVYTGRLISLDLQDTDIDNALRIIAEVSNLNIIASDDVSGKVTLRLIDVPWDQALDVILKTNGLDQVTEGNVIRIAPVDKLRQEREARRQAKKALEELEELSVQYYRVSYAKASEVQEQIEGVISERGTVTVDERTNQIIVKDIKKGQAEVTALIKRLDLRTPQVLLETQVVEGSRSILRDLGFQWNYDFSQAPEFGNATGLNFPNAIHTSSTVNFAAAGAPAAFDFILDSADGARSLGGRLTAIETEGRARVISRPQVATVNNKQAKIKSVETIRVPTPSGGTSVATGQGSSASGGSGSAFEEFDVGIELTVTPNVSPDYFVLLDMFAKSSTFGGRTVEGIPSTIEREATSTILVKSGQTFALGGIYKIDDTESITGVPWLKDIPFFGAVFRQNNFNKADEELIFFITPHIVEGSFDPSLM